MLPDFDAGLIGTVAGEEKTHAVSFPADYRTQELAGKTAQFRISVKGVEEATLPDLDEEFCKAFGVTEGGIDALRQEVAANMRRELEQTLRSRNKGVVMDQLLQANPVDVPNALIEAQIRDMQIEAMRRAGTKDPAQAPAPQQFVEPARRRAALGLILADIVKRQHIIVDPVRADHRALRPDGRDRHGSAPARRCGADAPARRQGVSIRAAHRCLRRRLPGSRRAFRGPLASALLPLPRFPRA